MNPIIKFATLFGLLAVELAIGLEPATSSTLAIVFGALMLFFVYRSFYGMRITSTKSESDGTAAAPSPAGVSRG
jgi:K(+)-stimulated pyrophosphate-energized sodium pump